VNAEKPVPTLQDLVYRLFQYGLSSWGAFSTTRYTSNNPKPPIQVESTSAGIETYSAELEGNAKNAMNLEFIHNNLHVSIRNIMGLQETRLTLSRTLWEEPNFFAHQKKASTSGALAI
jgi:hypothetical protein